MAAADEAAGAAAAADVPERPAGEGSGGKADTGLLLPLARIKKMMKEAQDVKIVSAEASWAVARATELFLQELAARSHAAMSTDSSRKALDYKDVAAVVQEWAAANFLGEMVPQKVKVGDVREQLQQQLDEVTPKCLDDS